MHPRELRFAGVLILAVLGITLVVGYMVGSLNKPIAPPEAPSERGRVEAAQPVGPDGRRVGSNLPAYWDVYVNDYADLLLPETKDRIRTDLIELYDQTGVEMTVLTIPSRATYGFEGTNEAFATALFNDWGIGDAERNDGVLVAVSRFDREMRVELGAGYGTARNADMKRVIDDHFLPHFRRDAYDWGIENGVEETIREIAGVYPGSYNSPAVLRGWSLIWRNLTQLVAPVLALMAAPFLAIPFAWRAYARRRPRSCHVCGTQMMRQAEDVDDAHLDGGQRLEEYVRSVDYDIWECPSCAALRIARYPAWFSRYGSCPSCSYRTLNSETTVLQTATTSRSGRKRIDYSCENCGYQNSETRTIPRRSKNRSSSGSGRSSFGGGRSSGGGASGSW